ncbi:right-handed parallel beta-helix repeat-containing protein [Bifidobacterium pullorum subsp. saeculare]|uniref:Right-handed parallel beta-helix repeat-containing protein n=1 Tax=Bifidobacterium pullorum subsp. saeculare TaxID=78257 RepID=A0A938WZN5_9BIFI|nr:right-handed parallel beta-helix repeat-containing protein [Bifidobacterium pullorum]MBM6699983.1 right-handed parallel beta-helix repeat-containing protein [Bifidobacterium pullorum subsp. saeculare]
MAEYHIHPHGDDLATGDAAHPFATISRAAAIARPGDTVVVHEGVYREQVDPAHGGVSDLERIVYRAAEGEHPVIKGSERVTGWTHDRGTVWKVTLPASLFGSFNPFREELFGDWLIRPDKDTEPARHLGDVYLNGRSFYESPDLNGVYEPQVATRTVDDGTGATVPTFDPDGMRYAWHAEVDAHTGETTVWANFQDADPNVELVEVNVRRTCFFPSRTHIDYITVSGFEMCQAATPWSPPTAPQFGMVGPNWAKGWVIEGNHLHDAKCSAVCLGKEASTGENEWYRTERKTGYQYQLEAVFKGRRIGWGKETIGGHRVRFNHIHDCGQNGVVGHMGCAFSEVSWNHIHRIGVKREFFGWEIAGIKFHAAIDAIIAHNDVHDCSLGIWLDWQAQGVRVSGNVCHRNVRDLMIEVSHGPAILDNNVFASPYVFQNWSQGSAFVHNLIAGTIATHRVMDRSTPYHFPHTTEVAGCAVVSSGDDRYRNNLFTTAADPLPGLGAPGLGAYAGYPTSMAGYVEAIHRMKAGENGGGDPSPEQPVYVEGNAYCGMPAAEQEPDAVCVAERMTVSVEEDEDAVTVIVDVPEAVAGASSPLTCTADLGTPRIVEEPYENADGTPIVFDSDILGADRGQASSPGPLAALHAGINRIVISRHPSV